MDKLDTAKEDNQSTLGVKKDAIENNAKLKRAYPWLRRGRWGVLFLFGLIVVVFEVYNHHQPGEFIFDDTEFVLEVLFYGILMPLSGAFLLLLLERIGEERDLASQEIDWKNAVNRRLLNTRRRDELVKTALQFPRDIAPAVSTSLYVYHPKRDHFELAGVWHIEGKSHPDIEKPLSSKICRACLSAKSPGPYALALCQHANGTQGSESTSRYCLPLLQGDELIALLLIYFPADFTITSRQVRILTGVAPELAMAIKNAQLLHSVTEQTQAVEAERNQIARTLHDTLGQNISFLRLKLDQYSNVSTLEGIIEIQRDIERMHDIANEAYEHIRGTLEDLSSSRKIELADSLRTYSEFVAERANLDLELHVEGTPVEINQSFEREVFYICREAINNIEQHAYAQNARIHMNWGEKDLTVIITDDGCGFDPGKPLPEGHFGLGIMHERAGTINGRLNIISEPNMGTTVTLEVPLIPRTQFTEDDGIMLFDGFLED